MLSPRVGMCCNNAWDNTDMSHCERGVCGYTYIRGLLEKYPTFFFMRTPDGL